MKQIRFTAHAAYRCRMRGTTEAEVERAIRGGVPEHAKGNRTSYRLNLEFQSDCMGEKYAVKQVAPVIREEEDEIVMITVYVFYF